MAITREERNTLTYSLHAEAVRCIRRMALDVDNIRCPRGVRHGDWIASLSANELYLLYFRTARQWAKAAREGDAWNTREECIRLAKHWLNKAAAVRKSSQVNA